MHPMLNIAVRAARSAGNIIARGFENREDLNIESKGLNDFVTKIDIALLHKGKLDQAVVFDPIRSELFVASKGAGAQLNGYRIRASKTKDISSSILATAFPFRNKARLNESLQQFQAIFSQAGDVRRSGSAALDLAYVAAGRYDGYWEKGLQSWDIAAGELLVKEAGGLVTDYKGNNDPLYDELKQAGSANGMVAGSPRVVQHIVKNLKA